MTRSNTDLTRRGLFLTAGCALAAPAILTAASRPAHAKAEMLGPSRPTHYRYTLGDFEVTALADGAIQLDGPHPIFGQDQALEDVQSLARENHLPDSKMEIAFTPVVVNTGTELVLFDAGNGAGRRPNAGHLLAILGDAGYQAEDIDVVVLTHFHPDHIGGLMEDGKPAFPNARYITTAAEYDFWSPAEKAEGPTERVGKLVQSNVVPLADKMAFLNPGEDAVSGITIVDASGHTPGHAAYHIESNGKRLLLWADTTNHYVASLQRPDWHVRFDMDKEKAAAARKQILGMVAADRIPAAGYHMPFPAVGYVEAKDGGFRWVPASYQLDLG